MPDILEKEVPPALLDVNYDDEYAGKYPRERDLKPGSEFHTKTLGRLLRMAAKGASAVSRHIPRWKEIDKALAVYVDLDEEEQDTQNEDYRKPTSFVVPLSVAVLATDLAYDTEVFLDSNPVFPYYPVGPEDRVKAILQEQKIQQQVISNKVKIPLHTTFRNGHAYGLGIGDCTWIEHWGKRTIYEPITELDPATGEEVITNHQKRRPRTLIFEGNSFQAWDPYRILLDDSVPLHEFQRGEFIGRFWDDNFTRLLGEELEEDSSLFNVRYCNHISNMSALKTNEDSRQWDGGSGYVAQENEGTLSRKLVRTLLYVRLIPAEWDFGPSEDPEIWAFEYVGDEVIVRAEELDLDHNTFPVAVNAPDYDGFSSIPNSHISTVFPMNRIIDWLISAIAKGQNTSLNGKLLIDPSIWNLDDLKQNKDGNGWICRKRRSAWGRDVKGWDSITTSDPTINNMNTAIGLLGLAKDLAGTADSSMGILEKTSGRTSASEAQGARASAISRLSRPAKMSSWMFMQDVAFLFGKHLQQFMSPKQQVRLEGRWSQILMEEYGMTGTHAEINPWDIDGNFDVVPGDASRPDSAAVDALAQFFQPLMANPMVQQEIIQTHDMARMFDSIARMGGVRNIQDFSRRGGQVRVVPDQMAQAGAQAGNLVPVGAQ